MKSFRTASCLALMGLLAGCAYVPSGAVPPRVVSPDYTATGSATQARAYVYGKVTVLEFDEPPLLLLVVDDQGRKISSERGGRFYRLPSVLGHFTAWADGQAVTFSAIPVIRVFSARAAVSAASIAMPVKAIVLPVEADAGTTALQRREQPTATTK